MSSGDVVLDGSEDVIFISAPPEIVHIKVRQRRSLEHGDADCIVRSKSVYTSD
jgi:hypothetical protein